MRLRYLWPNLIKTTLLTIIFLTRLRDTLPKVPICYDAAAAAQTGGWSSCFVVVFERTSKIRSAAHNIRFLKISLHVRRKRSDFAAQRDFKFNFFWRKTYTGKALKTLVYTKTF